MTKNQEIEILREAAAKLGKDSYCGEWLNSIIPHVESEIRSDFVPVFLPSHAEKQANEIIANAKERAKNILDNAQKEGERMQNAIQAARERARAELLRAAHSL